MSLPCWLCREEGAEAKMAIAAVIVAAIVGFIARLSRTRPQKAWLLGCTVVPAFVLFAEFVLPYQGRGVSMWPIALVLGGTYGVAASGFGVFLGGYFVRSAGKAA